MSAQWPELIERFNSLTESTKNILPLDRIFERCISCYAKRDILFAATQLDFRLQVQSGHEVLDSLYDDSKTPVILSIADLIEIEGLSPSVGNDHAFNLDQSAIHYAPWTFNTIREHVSFIAKSIYANPTQPVPIEDLTKMEALLKRFTSITIQFRVNMGTTNNLRTLINLVNGMDTAALDNEALFREIESSVRSECDIIKQLIDVGRTRMHLDTGKLSVGVVNTEIDRINRTFRW